MIEEFSKKLQNQKNEIKEKLKSIRAHHLTSAVLENIEVIAYGQKTPIKSIASIIQLTPLKIKIEPWDENVTKEIEKSLSQQNFGGRVSQEEKYLVVNFPSLTEESRKALLKNLNQLKEEIRIRARRERDDALKSLKNQKDNREVPENVYFKNKEKIDDEVKKFNDEIDKLFSEKEREVSQ